VTVAKALRICRKASHRFNFTANLFAIAPPEHFFALQYSRRLSMELEVVPFAIVESPQCPPNHSFTSPRLSQNPKNASHSVTVG
jgi:hypothetical protein